MGEVRQVQFGGKSGIVSQNTGAVESHGPAVGNVVDMGAFRTRKGLTSDRKVSIGEAFSGLSPKASTDATAKGTDGELSDRIERIKNSISRINQLMSDLKSVSKDDKP